MHHELFRMSANTKKNIIKDIRHHWYIRMPQILAQRDLSLFSKLICQKLSHFCQQEPGAKGSDVNNCHCSNMLQDWLLFSYCQDVGKAQFPVPYAIKFISDCYSQWNVRSNWIRRKNIVSLLCIFYKLLFFHVKHGINSDDIWSHANETPLCKSLRIAPVFASLSKY